MLYRIAPGKGEGKVVSVEDGDAVLVTADAPDLKAAHKLIRQAQSEGWESLKPKKGK